MDKKTLTELDYYRIRDEISGFCVSEESRFIFSRIEPFTNIQEIIERKNLSRQWSIYLSSKHSSPLLSWPQVFNIFKMLKVEGIALSLEQVRALGQFTTSINNLISSIDNCYVELGLKELYDITKTIPDVSPVHKEIYSIITPDGEIRDLPQLRAIRERIASLNLKIKHIIHSYTQDRKYQDALESTVPVLRGDRQVLAVKSNKRSYIPGIIHELSASGQTVYIEPEECVKCSNELIEAEYELIAETRKILMELARRISIYTEDLINALKIMEKLDITYAASKWGLLHNCTYAIDSDTEPLCLIKARHPLLGSSCVPIDVRFLDGKRILIITGPNTGGKTVTLKTIALFSMLNQSGFPIPCEEGSRLPLFTNVFADIGDEQSLDQSLSTFSGHMKNIAKAVRHVNDKSLVLLDELGSGTDPQEGAAISMAVLDRLIEKGAFVLITTHQGVIKNYGYTHKECINASVEFSEESLSPTYHLLMGVPGESHALDIAKKSGLPGDIVNNARNYILHEKADVSSLIKGLNAKHLELDELKKKQDKEREELEQKKHAQAEKALSLKKQEHDLKKGYQRESQKFLDESRKMLENLVRSIKEGDLTREKTVGVKKFIQEMTSVIEAKDQALEKEEEEIEKETEIIEKEKQKTIIKQAKKRHKNSDALKQASSLVSKTPDTSGHKVNSKPLPPLVFSIGQEVTSKTSKQTGIIVGGSKGRWDVQFGAFKINMKEKDLNLVRPNENTKPNYTVDFADDSSMGTPQFELRLMGLRPEEAIKELEHQIDLCVLSNFKTFSVIHGKGTGVLQQVVQDYLSNCPTVEDFRFAPPEDGGFGKTYVTLR